MIRFACSQCGKMISAGDEHAGRKAKCPMCQAVQVIPAAGADPVKPAGRPAAPAPAQTPPRPAAPPSRAVQPAKPARKPPEDDYEEAEELEEVEEVPEEVEEDFEVVEEVPEEEEERPRPRKKKKKRRKWHGEWADCPNCGAPGDATRLSWTLWGGFIGPLFINHVRCNQCGSTYNGKHGDSNTGRIAIYIAVNVGIALVIVCASVLTGVLEAAH